MEENAIFSWPSGIRDTTKFPTVNLNFDVTLRQHLEAFCKMDGVGWNDYDTQKNIGQINGEPQRYRAYRKLYETLGVLYKEDDKIRLSKLGMAIVNN